MNDAGERTFPEGKEVNVNTQGNEQITSAVHGSHEMRSEDKELLGRYSTFYFYISAGDIPLNEIVTQRCHMKFHLSFSAGVPERSTFQRLEAGMPIGQLIGASP